MTTNKNEDVQVKRNILSGLIHQAASKLTYDEIDAVIATFRVNKLIDALKEYANIQIQEVQLFDSKLDQYSDTFQVLKKRGSEIANYVAKNEQKLNQQTPFQSYQMLLQYMDNQTRQSSIDCPILVKWLNELRGNVELDVKGVELELNRAITNKYGLEFKATQQADEYVSGRVREYLLALQSDEKYPQTVKMHTNIKNDKFNYPLTEKGSPSPQLYDAFVTAATAQKRLKSMMALKDDKGLEKLFFYTQRIAHLKVKYNKCGGFLGMGGGESKNPIFDKIEKDVAALIAQYPKKSLKEIYQDSKIVVDEIIKNKGITVSDSKEGVQKIDLGNKEALSIVKGLQEVLPRLMLIDEADLMKEAKSQQNKAPSMELAHDFDQKNTTFKHS